MGNSFMTTGRGFSLSPGWCGVTLAITSALKIVPGKNRSFLCPDLRPSSLSSNRWSGVVLDPIDDAGVTLSSFQTFMRAERIRHAADSAEFRRNVLEAQDALARGFRMPPHLLDAFAPGGKNDGQF